MKAQLAEGGKAARVLGRIYRHSGIVKRHSVIRDYATNGDGGAPGGAFYDSDSDVFLSPSTRQRNDIYAVEARRLFAKVTANVLDESDGFEARDITHVITASCTGFYAPGPDYYLVRDLGLSPTVQRFHVGFMGCYAAFPVLRMADAFCRSNPDAVVLVACLELCTLHLQPSEVMDNIIATSVFADGAGAAIVSSRAPRGKGKALRIDQFLTTLVDDSEADMAWKIGDNGFEMVLSTYVPKILEANVGRVVGSLLQSAGVAEADVDRWAIHPGGRAILDKVEKSVGLDPASLDPSRRVLRDYGNMSSATIWFVLKDTLSLEPVDSEEQVYAMAFGPGLTVESALFQRI